MLNTFGAKNDPSVVQARGAVRNAGRVSPRRLPARPRGSDNDGRATGKTPMRSRRTDISGAMLFGPMADIPATTSTARETGNCPEIVIPSFWGIAGLGSDCNYLGHVIVALFPAVPCLRRIGGPTDRTRRPTCRESLSEGSWWVRCIECRQPRQRPSRSPWLPRMVVAVALGSFTTAASPALAEFQESATVRPVRCVTCRILTERWLTIGTERDGIELAPVGVLPTDSRGRIYAVAADLAQIPVFSSKGALIKVLGKRGQGPGEFGVIGPVVVGDNDSLFVFDPALRRVTVFTAEYRVARTFAIPLTPDDAHSMGASGFLVSGSFRTQESAGIPLHHLSISGELLGPWTTSDVAGFDARTTPTSRILTPGTGLEIWAAHRNRYRIDRWAPPGRHIGTVERKATWFEPWTHWSNKRDQPRTTGIRLDSAGRLWHSTVVGKEYRAPVAKEERRLRTERPRDIDPEVYRTFIEAIDPQESAVLATVALDGFFAVNPKSDFLIQFERDPDGRVLLSLQKYRLVQ